MAQENKAQSEIRYLNPVTVDVKKKKYCRFKKLGIKYVDYKDGEFLKKFLNEQGKILPVVLRVLRRSSRRRWPRPSSAPVISPSCPS